MRWRWLLVCAILVLVGCTGNLRGEGTLFLREDTMPECYDKQDNDGDGAVDIADEGCTGFRDPDESNCGDGVCEGDETRISCTADCGTIRCTDGTCDTSKPEREPLSGTNTDVFYVSLDGNDAWSGTLSVPSGTDGPFATLERTRDAARDSAAQAVIVYVRGGTYELTQPFTMDTTDTAGKHITYTSYPGERAVLSGGRHVSLSWSQDPTGYYFASVPSDLPARFNSVFIDNRRAVRARVPDVGSYYRILDGWGDSHRAFKFTRGELDHSWSNLREVEIVTLPAWRSTRHKVRRLFYDTVFVQGRTLYPFDDWLSERYYAENVFEELTQGEWYVNNDTRTLYYWPKPGENIHGLNVVIPRLENLMAMRVNFHPSQGTLYAGSDCSISCPTRTVRDTEHAILFDGENDKVRIPGSGDVIPQTGVSAFAWLKHGTTGRYERVMGQGWRSERGDRGRWHVNIRNDAIVNCKVNVNRTWYGLNSPDPLDDQAWHHIGCVYDGTTLALYKDGTVWNSRKISGDLTGGLYPVGLGDFSRDGPNYNQWLYTGGMDDFRLYTRALTSQEITDLYTGTEPANPLVSLDFEEPTAFTDVTIANLSFRHTDWTLPRGGLVGGQASMPVHSNNFQPMYVPGVRVDRTGDGVRFVGNDFSLISGYALDILSGTAVVEENVMDRLGAGGIVLGRRFANEYELIEDAVVKNNTVKNFGEVYQSSVGIIVKIARDTRIVHNEVRNGTYCGISLGWFWDVRDSDAVNNLVAQNEISHVMQELHDCGGIYTLGKQPGTQIRDNIIHDIQKTPLHWTGTHLRGIYTDQGTSEITIKNNLVYRTGDPINLHRSFDNIVENNLFLKSDWTAARWAGENKTVPFASTLPDGNIVRRNLFVCDTVSERLIKVVDIHSLNHSDNNLFYCYMMGPGDPRWNYAWWVNNTGFEQNSIVADPLFVDWANDDFRLRQNSPAFAIGFQEFI